MEETTAVHGMFERPLEISAFGRGHDRVQYWCFRLVSYLYEKLGLNL